jgi:hypothetical protein
MQQTKTPVTENSRIKYSTSIAECSAIYLGIFRRRFTMRRKKTKAK